MDEGCALCGKRGDALKRCTGCWAIRYCSADCQKRHWSRHKVTCVKRPATSRQEKEKKDKSPGDKKKSPPGQKTSSKTEKDGKESAAQSDRKEEPSLFTCKTCKTQTSTVERCGRCQDVTYCSRDCRRADWMAHKLTCIPIDPAAESHDETEQTENSKVQDEASSKLKVGLPEAAGEKKTDKTATPSPGPEFAAEETDGELKTCQTCKAQKKNMKRCGRCHDVTYCSRGCQTADWISHKVTCTPIDVLTTEGYKETERKERAAKAAQRFSSSSPGLITWQEARSRAARVFPFQHVVDDFNDLDSDFMGPSFSFQPWMRIGMGVVAVCRLTTSYFHPFRHARSVEDISGRSLYVIFYNEEFPWPYFLYSQLKEGNFICIQDAFLHLFGDGSIGFRIDDPSDVRILEPRP